MTRRVRLIGLLLITAVAFGCGDDDGGDGGSGGSAGSPSGGSGGTGGGGTGGGDTGGTGGDTGDAGDVVMCMGEVCEDVPSPAGTPLPACCDEIGGGCGGIVSTTDPTQCVATGLPGDPDTSCPEEMSVISTPVPGCCTPDGECGLQSGTLMGCVERSRYPAEFLMGGMAVEAVACGGGGGDDGGT